MTIDVERARRDTPGVARVAHLNNAGAALPPSQVTDAVIAYLRLEAETGGYEAAAAEAGRIEATYLAIARLIGCAPDEVAVVENATRAWDMAFYAMSFEPGDRILTAHAEYASNVIAYLQIAARTGAVVEVVDDDEHGQLSVADLRRRLADGGAPVKLIAMTHVPTQGGLVNPAEEVGAAAREAGVPFLLDACQSVGQLPVDVERIGCDMLSATGRKFLRGPRHRFPVRAARHAGPPGAAVSRPARRDLDGTGPVRDPRRRAAFRELGDQLRRQDRAGRRRRVRPVLGP